MVQQKQVVKICQLTNYDQLHRRSRMQPAHAPVGLPVASAMDAEDLLPLLSLCCCYSLSLSARAKEREE